MKIRQLNIVELEVAAGLLAQAMLHNPVHLAVFGANIRLRQQRLYKFFQIILPLIFETGVLAGAFQNDKLVGVLGWIKPYGCKFTIGTQTRLIAKIFFSYQPYCSFRLLWWLWRWRINDCKKPHLHIGPLAVAEEYRKQGIAAALLQQVLSMPQPAWLETDLLANVNYYKKYGFKVIQQVNIFGTKTWLCLR